MSNVKQRLEKGAAILDQLDQRRRETCSPRLGYDTEYLIIAVELRQIENELVSDPGALAPWLATSPRQPEGESGETCSG